eukprot:Phypoly_transcript_05584.p1 GENE.Phypoly_transcript_05584~~Phypoly_transcript_05584.p1  ORF type:complete len:288 (+),score=49.37 Phypoly_transcript_05584:80-943(+)
MTTLEDEKEFENLAAYETDSDDNAENQTADATKQAATKKTADTYVAIHAAGFREFLLKPELLRAIVDCGFEHPSEVQHECIPQAILGTDVICQAKSGMGKTAVFVLSVLQQLDTNPAPASALVLCYTRELAYQICHEFDRFRKYLPSIKTAVFYGGIPVQTNKDLLRDEQPHVIIGTPGRILQLAEEKSLVLKNVKHFVLDECDKMLDSLDKKKKKKKKKKKTPHDKQVMMFSATLSEEIRGVCKKFMHNVILFHIFTLSILFCFTFFCCSVNRGVHSQTLRTLSPL